MSAFIHGIYGGDVNQWSMQAQFPKMLEYERRYGSVALGSLIEMFRSDTENPQTFRGQTGLTFREGLQTLPDTLVTQLSGYDHVRIRGDTSVTSLNRRLMDGKFEVGTRRGVEVYDRVVLTIPAHALQNMTDGNVITKDIRDLCSEILVNDMAPVTLCYGKSLNLLKPSLGVLVPQQERTRFTGVIFDHDAYAERQPPNSTVVTVMFGGPEFQKVSKLWARDDLVSEAKRVMMELFDCGDEPDVAHAEILPLAMPQYHIGHTELISSIRQKLPPGIAWIGSSTDGIGVPDCIQSAYQLAATTMK
jgi:oxygen-dependent protoporphyrinogen oxidase